MSKEAGEREGEGERTAGEAVRGRERRYGMWRKKIARNVRGGVGNGKGRREGK